MIFQSLHTLLSLIFFCFGGGGGRKKICKIAVSPLSSGLWIFSRINKTAWIQHRKPHEVLKSSVMQGATAPLWGKDSTAARIQWWPTMRGLRMPGQTWANCHEWLEKQAWMKMYLLLNMVIFHCDVSFLEGIVYGDSRSSKCNVILVVTVCYCYREGAIYTQSLPMEEIYFDMIDVNVRLLSLEVFAERKAVADVFFLNRDLSNHYWHWIVDYGYSCLIALGLRLSCHLRNQV